MSQNNSSISELTLRILNAVENLTEDEKKEFLLLIGDQRRFSRKPYLMEVSYKTKNYEFKDFILDISPGGTFIETENNFFTGQELVLKLFFKNLKNPFEIKGCVVWHSSNGIGVRFIFETIEQQQELINIINDI
ncbi:MAG: PilZ domain-containing protein [Desulfobacteraceae bacterium]|nr:PilZ domain-containing protein [Desulfobacteraceae bacterium]